MRQLWGVLWLGDQALSGTEGDIMVITVLGLGNASLNEMNIKVKIRNNELTTPMHVSSGVWITKIYNSEFWEVYVDYIEDSSLYLQKFLDEK
ncbi:MAG: hypothetical protein ACFFBD_23145 [Candidatus Hodarchaeota archaeon]